MTEYVDIVDENDKAVGKATREESNKKNLRRRGSGVLVFNKKNEILMHKRASEKLEFPGLWDFGSAETLISKESYESAAIRGLKEELGITGISNFDIKFLFKFKHTGKNVKRFYKVFSLHYNKNIKINKEEISEAKFVSEDFLNKMLEKEKFIDRGLEVYKEYRKIRK